MPQQGDKRPNKELKTSKHSQEKAKITGMDLKVTKESMAHRDQKKAKTRARESETPHQNNPKWMFGIPAG